MKYVTLPEGFLTQRLPFYLSMEEYLARTMCEEYFFMWQVNPTVIFGRNQRIESEINLQYCRENNIDVVRRKSGGGCVYANPGNIMFSYITSSTEGTSVFSNYTERVAEMLRSLGLNAEATGRNDVLIDGRKVSGNAFYHVPGRSIVHGTMLYDTNFAHLSNALTPSKSKLQSKGVKSVESRITTLNQHLDIGISEFMTYARNYMCSDEDLMLNADDIEKIREIEKGYYETEWLFGHRGTSTVTRSKSIAGAGNFDVGVNITAGKIKGLDISGDFFPLADIDEQLLSHLIDVNYDREAIKEAVSGIEIGKVISNLTNEQFINIII